MLSFENKYIYWWYLILACLAFFSFYFAIGTYPLFDNNEGLYANIAQLMLRHRSFVIPQLNCVPYIEKPPFLYWLLSGSFSLFGFTPFAARLVTTTSAALICVVLVLFTKKLKQLPIGILSALIFASSIGVSIIARMVYFDMLFTLLISCTLCYLFYWNETQKIIALRISYLFLGLAILTKGLVAVILICGSFLLFLWVEGNLRQLTKALDPLGIMLLLAIILPWHIAAAIQHKGFFKQYIIAEHFLRFLNQREPHDYYHGPIYYYLPRIIIYLLPWSSFMPLIFWRTKNLPPPEQKLLRFSWCWLLLPLLFFSLSSAKANYYMIVSMPALAIILSIKIRHLFTPSYYRMFSRWSAGILVIIASVLSIGYYFFPTNFTIIAIIYSLVASSIALIMWRHSEIIAVMLAALIIPLILVMVSYIQSTKHDLSAQAAGVYLTSYAKDQPIYIYQDFENISALAFYTPKCFKIIDSKSNDLYYGKNLSQFKSWFITKTALLRDIVKQQVYIVVPIKKLQQFYREMAPIKFSLVQSFKQVVILSSR